MKRVRLSIHSFRKIVKYILIAVAIIVSMCVMESVAEYFLLDDTREEARTVLHDFYTMDENIDNLFLGCSHVYFNIDPEKLDEMTQKENFNLSTPLQPLIASYYLLKEADKYNDLEHVYIEMFYSVSTGSVGNVNTWRVMNYMPMSFNKLDFMLHSGGDDKYLNFFPSRRTWKEAFNFEHIAETLRGKQSREYKNYEWVKINERGTEYFLPKGYVYTEYVYEDRSDLEDFNDELSKNPMTEEAAFYLEKILDYCKKENIEVTLFSAPLYSEMFEKIQGYHYYAEQVTAIAEKYQTEYLDFNLVETDFPKDDWRLWRDKEHMNIWGAEQFTEIIYRYLMK